MTQLICAAADALGTDGGLGTWFAVWMAYAAFGFLAITGFSTAMFVHYYAFPTYEKWRMKSNPRYPSPTYVLGEAFLGGVLGPFAVTLVSSIHLALIANGTLKHHCETPLTWSYRVYSLALVVVVTDVYEWFWHYLGHYLDGLWVVHKHHHKYYNPTPYGTIADWPMDNFMRSLFPIVSNVVSFWLVGMPVDLDMCYLMPGLINGIWGNYLHCGHELECIPYDHPVWNTSFQHYAHHAISVKNKPYHTGFVVKFWDNMIGSVYRGEQVIPAVEDQKLGNRSRERWEKEVKPNLPDYSVLLSPKWLAANWSYAPGLSISARVAH